MSLVSTFHKFELFDSHNFFNLQPTWQDIVWISGLAAVWEGEKPSEGVE